MTDPKKKAAPDFIPAEAPDFIPDQSATPSQGVLAPAQETDEQRKARPATLREIGSGALDVATGVGKGALNTLTGLSRPIHNIPGIGPALVPESGLQELERIKTPSNTAQKVGYTGEQIGEWFLPTGAEEKAGAFAAEHLPTIARWARPAARIATGAVEAGARNVTQGGNFETGAAVGAGGAVAGEGARVLAPRVMEAALGIPRRVRKYGAEPGEAALSELRGIRPSKLQDEAAEHITDLDTAATTEARRSPLRGSLQEARGLIDQEIAGAQERNSPALLKRLSKVKNQLTQEFDASGRPVMERPLLDAETPTGIVDEFGHAIVRPSQAQGPARPRLLPAEVPASKVRAMRQGVDEEIRSWTPPGTKPDDTLEAIRKNLYGTLSDEAHRSAPNTTGLDKRMSSLIPVHDHAGNKALAEGVVPQVMKRLQTPTGALVGAGFGGTLGYKEGGVPGALAGAGAGLIAPSLISQPSLWIAGSRALNSPVPIRGLRGLLLQLDRPDEEKRAR